MYKGVVYYYVDALVQTVGQEAAKAVLRHAGLLDLLSEAPPRPDETVSMEFVRRFKEASMRFFGQGYGAVVRRAGYLAAVNMRLPTALRPFLGMMKAFEDWRKLMGRVGRRLLEPTGATMELELIKRGYRARVFDVRVEVREVKCRASGDECCEFLVTSI